MEVEELTPEDLQMFKERLQNERRRFQDSIRRRREAIDTLDRGRGTDELDEAAHATEHAQLSRMIHQEIGILREVDHALSKFETGDYGLCEGTEEPIAKRRLLSQPWARYSVQYQEQLERERRIR